MFGKKINKPTEAADEDQPARQQPGAPSSERRVKTLSKITAAACALAILAIGIGIYSQLSVASKASVLSEKTTTVLVSSRDIKAGEAADAAMFETANVPTSLVTSESLESANDLVGKVAITSIPKGAQIASSFFAGKGNASSLANALPSGKTAISVAVDAEKGMAGLLRQGDYVQVLSFVSATDGTSQPQEIAQKAEVLALDSQLIENSNAYTTITLSVTQAEAKDIRAAQEEGSLNFVLYSSAESVQEAR